MKRDMCILCRFLHDLIVFRNLSWLGTCPSSLSGCASTRVYVRGAAYGWIFLRSYLGFCYVRTDSNESIYNTSIIKVVDILCRNSPYYVAYMLLPICTKFCYANGDSPYAIFWAFLPVRIRGVPVCVPGSVCDVSATVSAHNFITHTGIPICKFCTNFRRMYTHPPPVCIQWSQFANFVLIFAACTPVSRPYAYGDPHMQ
jgi:hypothetical protein